MCNSNRGSLRQINRGLTSPQDLSAHFDLDQSMEALYAAECICRRAEASLAKYGSETSTGADLLIR